MQASDSAALNIPQRLQGWALTPTVSIRPPAGKMAAARSHQLNEEYVARFNLEACSLGQDQTARIAATATAASPRPRRSTQPAVACDASATGGAAQPPSNTAQPRGDWRAGPADPAGTAVPLAASNILCASVDWERQEAVFGCADHALYTVDLRQRKKARTLYTKRCGHTEW